MGSSSSYRSISDDVYRRCVESAFVAVEDRNRKGQLIRRHVYWDEALFKAAILEEAMEPEVLAALDSEGRDRAFAEISESQFGPAFVPSRAQRRRWKRAGLVAQAQTADSDLQRSRK
ncbi:MAG: hypothetical protein ACE5IZ_09430 [Dehalococcoidia bacterium]